jgi:cytochrome o ubiquinol oxidase subunit II
MAMVSRGRSGLTLDERTYATLRRQSVLADARGDLGLETRAEPIIMTLGRKGIFHQIVAKYHQTGGASASPRWGGTGLPQGDAKSASK